MPDKLKTQFWGTIKPRDFADDVTAIIEEYLGPQQAIAAQVAEALALPEGVVRTAVISLITENAGGGGGGGGGVPMGFGSHDATTVYSATASTAAVSANMLYAVPFYFTNPVVLGATRLYVTSGSAGNVRIGCYASGSDREDPGSFRKPTTLIGEAGAISTASSGSKYLAFDPAYEIDAGLYFMVALFSGTPTVQVLTATSSGFGVNAPANPATYYSGVTEAFTYAALPETFPGFLTSSVAPMPQISVTLS